MVQAYDGRLLLMISRSFALQLLRGLILAEGLSDCLDSGVLTHFADQPRYVAGLSSYKASRVRIPDHEVGCNGDADPKHSHRGLRLERRKSRGGHVISKSVGTVRRRSAER